MKVSGLDVHKDSIFVLFTMVMSILRPMSMIRRYHRFAKWVNIYGRKE